jgi:type III secretion protein U
LSEKTEQPTARRLRKLHEQGDSPVSTALAQAVGFLAAIAVLPALAAAAFGELYGLVDAGLAHPETPAGPAELASVVLRLSVPLLLAVALPSAFVAFAQTGGVPATRKLVPDLNRLNPLIGIKNLFSAERMVSVLRSLVAAVLVSYLAFRLLSRHGADLANSVGNVEGALSLVSVLGSQLLWIAGAVGLALGAVDLAVVRRGWLKRNRMTKDEVKREFRESEGDPEVKAARRRAHHQALFGATLAALKDASVLIVNPTHLATALRYQEDEDAAPRVIGQGEGEFAQKMIAAAHHYGVPVVRDVPVAQALRDLEIGDEIPEALYEAVATILREIWDASGREIHSD